MQSFWREGEKRCPSSCLALFVHFEAFALASILVIVYRTARYRHKRFRRRGRFPVAGALNSTPSGCGVFISDRGPKSKPEETSDLDHLLVHPQSRCRWTFWEQQQFSWSKNPLKGLFVCGMCYFSSLTDLQTECACFSEFRTFREFGTPFIANPSRAPPLRFFLVFFCSQRR